MTDVRSFDTATLLQDGKVLIVGGLSSSSGSGSSGIDPATQTAELYDPSSGTFTKLTAPLVAPRALHTATLLQDGKVLIAGGLDTGGSAGMLASAELYDPATQTFVKTGDMKQGHAFHAAAILPDGKVIIAGFAGSLTDMLGGGLGGGTATPAAELQRSAGWRRAVRPGNGHVLGRPGGAGRHAQLRDAAADRGAGDGGGSVRIATGTLTRGVRPETATGPTPRSDCRAARRAVP